MKDGSQHVLQDMGLQAMTRPDLRVQFADGTADVSDLLAQAGPISLAKVVAEVAVSSGDGDPLQKNKASAAEVSADALATSDATAAPPGAPALAMEAQARGLIERDYIELQEPEIEDLRPLARALNVMVVRVRAMLDKGDREVAEIREQLDHDPLTKAATRPAFVDGLLHSLEHDAYGAVLLVHINDIEGLNLRLGRRRTDDFIVALATILRTRLMLALGADGFVLARLNGADFGVLMPGLVPESAITQVRLIEEALQVLSEDGLTDMALPAALGAARYRLGESLSDVLARADSGLGIAMAGRHFEIVDATPDRTNSLGVGQWRSVIESALGAGRVSLNMLQVVDARGTALHQEAQPLLTALDGRLVTASQLLPAAIRCGRSIDIGVRAIELALVALADVDGPLAVGVAAQCLEHSVFLRRLQALLRLHPVVAPRLVLEVQMNDASSRSLRSMANFAKAVNNLGCSVALGELGTQIELLSILDHARLRHVRLAQQAVVGLARQSHRRVFVKLMCELGGREGFAVVGPEGIVAEDQAALFALGGAGVVTPMELAASA
jgi:EAL domain-containing protein (putative c-di-GMP-specific phosphodiesterase class I)/GGDEF domain-containing protein